MKFQSSVDLKKCTECNGAGVVPIHICHGDEEVCRRKCPEPDPCQFCNATGYTDEYILRPLAYARYEEPF